MSEKSGFFNSSNGDRKYKAEFFSEYFSSFIGNGVFPNPSTSLQVISNNNMTVTLKAGKAWINGYYYNNDSDLILSIDVADGVLKRIDRVVMQYNTVNRTITAKVKKGTFSSTPIAPTLQRDSDAYELGIADIYIANGATSISQANITDLRLETTKCGIVHGVIDQVDTTTLWNQYQAKFEADSQQFEADFNAWFATIQGVLDGDTAGNLLNLINQNTADITALESSLADNVTQINSINTQLAKNKLPLKGVLYDVSDLTTIESTLINMLTNASFYVWPMGNNNSFTVGSNEDKYVCGNWRIKTQDASCVASKLNLINGGINLNMTFGATQGIIYLRELVPVIIPMSKKTYTFFADIECDGTINTDLYIQARKDTSDETRVLVVDSESLILNTGRHKVACTFTVPDVDNFITTLDIKNSLEVALRFSEINKTVNVKVYECVITDGEVIKSNSIVNPSRDFNDVELFHEAGSCQIGGFSSTVGQKKVTIPFRTKKIRVPVSTQITDLAGNLDKISIYDTAGARTDNIAYTVVTTTQEYLVLIVNNSSAAGIAFYYTVSCYF